MTTKNICKLLRDIMLTKDPYGFQHHKMCNCSYFCQVKYNEGNDEYFPKNYEEFLHIRKIIEDNNCWKKNSPNEKGS